MNRALTLHKQIVERKRRALRRRELPLRGLKRQS